jgi:inosine-uridine nucleoside N-ribohydrolase
VTSPIPIIIDTDVGADPDDALALILALASPEVDVRGVTIVSGDVDWRARIATRLLGMAGRSDIPVFLGRGNAQQMLGSEGEGLLGLPYQGPEAIVQTTPAVDWLLAESCRVPFHLVAIGPLTNVAAAIEEDPGFAGRLIGLTVMGGLLDERTMPMAWQRAIQERGAAAWPDYNTMRDPAAALTVARCGIPITWVTLDATMRAALRAAARKLPPTMPGTRTGSRPRCLRPTIQARFPPMRWPSCTTRLQWQRSLQGSGCTCGRPGSPLAPRVASSACMSSLTVRRGGSPPRSMATGSNPF